MTVALALTACEVTNDVGDNPADDSSNAESSDGGETGSPQEEGSEEATGIPEGRFSCGMFGGSCEQGTEICIVELRDGQDRCSSCIVLDDPCEEGDGCDCIADLDATAWEFPCADEPVCEANGDGLTVRCVADSWACG